MNTPFTDYLKLAKGDSATSARIVKRLQRQYHDDIVLPKTPGTIQEMPRMGFTDTLKHLARRAQKSITRW